MIPFFLAVWLFPIFKDENASRLVGTAIFALASFTDFLDGHVARSRNLITNFGKFMDPVADKLLVSAALICMVATNDLHPLVAILIISREFLVTSFRILAADENIVIAASWWGKIKTNFQILMTIYILLGIQKINPTLKFIGDVLIWAASVLTVVSAYDYLAKNKEVLKQTK
jgi:CDP-diacylglycerol--glycerol-3-phosphate 3-phosphatidyltransferase